MMYHDLTWRKSSYSDAKGDCVEVAEVGDDRLVRDSKDPQAGALHLTAAGFRALLQLAEGRSE